MRFRKLRIAWSVGWAVAVVMLIALWAHTARNQVKAAAWISKSNYISFVAFKQWMQVDAYQPDWQPTAYLHSLLVANPGPFVSPVHRWYVGPIHQTGAIRGISIIIPLWIPAMLSAALAVLPWVKPLLKLRRFSLSTLLIATTLVAVGLGLIAWLIR
jgi:hypothetical protein